MFSFIVLNYNGANVVIRCLESIIHQDSPKPRHEIIVVDNASSDGSDALIESRFHTVQVIRSATNRGYAGGMNLGATHAKGNVLVFMNNDTRLSKDWLRTMTSMVKDTQASAVVGSRIYFDASMTILNHAGGLISFLGGGFDIGFGEHTKTTSPSVSSVGYVSGAALLIPRGLFEKLEGFDESYFLYCEDVDLCWRAWLLGYRVIVQPAATLVHQYQSAQAGYWTRYLHWHKNSLSNILKNFELRTLATAMILQSSLQAARVVSAIRWRSPWRVVILVRANLWVLRNLSSIMTKRAAVQMSRRVSDRALLRKGVFLPLRSTFMIGRRMLLIPET
jgi:GT2 family glycosyltransferase